MQKITRTEKCLSALSYLPLLVLLPFLLEYRKRSSDFVHFHAKRGLILFAVECALFAPLVLLARALSAFWDPIGSVVYILIALLALVFLFFALYGTVLVLRSQKREIPLFFGCALGE